MQSALRRAPVLFRSFPKAFERSNYTGTAPSIWSVISRHQHPQLRSHLSTRHSSTYSTIHQDSDPKSITPSILTKSHQHSPGNTIGIITISNPAKINLVNSPLITKLKEACTSLSSDNSLRAVVLTGATHPAKAASFIGGADISEMASFDSSDPARAFITRIHDACAALRALPVPVIARVNGFCVGAGLEIMAVCDLRIATRKSVFAMPEVKVGIPSVVEAAMLPGQIGWGKTRRFLYLAENIDAVVAEQWGLVEKVVDDEKALDSAVEDWVEKLVEMGPKAIRSQKVLMQEWENGTLEEGIQAGIDAFAEAYEDGGKEPKEMMGRFLNRKR